MDKGCVIVIGNSWTYGKPEGTLLVRSALDGYYIFEEVEWPPESFWDWCCKDETGVLLIYDEEDTILAEFELEHLSEVVFIDNGEYVK